MEPTPPGEEQRPPLQRTDLLGIHPDAHRRYIERLRALSPEQRIARLFSLRRLAKALREG